jgi:hypothetical protein
MESAPRTPRAQRRDPVATRTWVLTPITKQGLGYDRDERASWRMTTPSARAVSVPLPRPSSTMLSKTRCSAAPAHTPASTVACDPESRAVTAVDGMWEPSGLMTAAVHGAGLAAVLRRRQRAGA